MTKDAEPSRIRGRAFLHCGRCPWTASESITREHCVAPHELHAAAGRSDLRGGVEALEVARGVHLGDLLPHLRHGALHCCGCGLGLGGRGLALVAQGLLVGAPLHGGLRGASLGAREPANEAQRISNRAFRVQVRASG